jgi:hypothetical protein
VGTHRCRRPKLKSAMAFQRLYGTCPSPPPHMLESALLGLPSLAVSMPPAVALRRGLWMCVMHAY